MLDLPADPPFRVLGPRGFEHLLALAAHGDVHPKVTVGGRHVIDAAVRPFVVVLRGKGSQYLLAVL